MKIKRIASLIMVILLMFSFSFNSFALLGKRDPNNPYEDISFVDSANEDSDSTINNIKKSVSDKSQKTIDALTAFWNSYGLLSIVIILVLCVVIATAVCSHEKKKLKKIRKQIRTKK